MLLEEEKRKKDYARTFLLCLFSCLVLLECSCAARPVTRQVTLGQSSSVSEPELIQQVTQGQSFHVSKQELTQSSERWTILRDQAPSSFIFTINSFSLLANSGKNNYETGVFEAGGHKWRMILYPKGNTDETATNSISVYVALENPSSLSGDVYAEVRFFAYNQRQNKYLMVQELPMNRFSALNSVAGSAEFIPLSSPAWLTEYLVNDNCIFGSEIRVYNQPAQQQQILSMIKNPAGSIFTWRIMNFNRDQDKYTSGDFVVGGQTWQLLVFPKGVVEETGRSLSAFLYLADYQKLRPKEEVFVRGKLRVLGPSTQQPAEKPFWTWLNAMSTDWGRRDLLPLTKLNEYIVQGSLTIQVEIEEMSQTTYLP